MRTDISVDHADATEKGNGFRDFGDPSPFMVPRCFFIRLGIVLDGVVRYVIHGRQIFLESYPEENYAGISDKLTEPPRSEMTQVLLPSCAGTSAKAPGNHNT